MHSSQQFPLTPYEGVKYLQSTKIVLMHQKKEISFAVNQSIALSIIIILSPIAIKIVFTLFSQRQYQKVIENFLLLPIRVRINQRYSVMVKCHLRDREVLGSNLPRAESHQRL